MWSRECKLTMPCGAIASFNRHIALCMTPTQMQSHSAGHFRLFRAWLGHPVDGIQSVAAGDPLLQSKMRLPRLFPSPQSPAAPRQLQRPIRRHLRLHYRPHLLPLHKRRSPVAVPLRLDLPVSVHHMDKRLPQHSLRHREALRRAAHLPLPGQRQKRLPRAPSRGLQLS